MWVSAKDAGASGVFLRTKSMWARPPAACNMRLLKLFVALLRGKVLGRQELTKSLVIRRWLHEMRALVISVCRVHAWLKRLDDACGVR